jgi:uncharacterized protein (UPF0261 family)
LENTVSKTILMIGAFDVKAKEYALVRTLIEAHGCSVLTMNIGVLGATDRFPIDVDHDQVARAGGSDIGRLQKERDRGKAMQVMSQGAAVLTRRIYAERRFDGVFGMGGGGGSSVIGAAMQTLPIGVPKVLLSTVAGGDTSAYVGIKDVTMIPSIVDIAGINPISQKVFRQAAGAICGMVAMDYESSRVSKPIIAATMFGNTTVCVDRCRQALSDAGYQVLVFHCTGAGGRTMEGLIEEGYVEAVLDITTTEWADEVCGGIYSAGNQRLSAPGQAGIPHLIVPGCVDMANFGPKGTIPEKYKDRLLYPWNPANTLMRTNVAENRQMGEVFARKANAARGPVAFLVPLRGVSILDGDGQPFCDRKADAALVHAIKENLNEGIRVTEMDNNVNDPEFADKAVEMLLDLMA